MISVYFLNFATPAGGADISMMFTLAEVSPYFLSTKQNNSDLWVSS